MQGEFLSIETAQKLAKAEKLEKNWDELKEWLENLQEDVDKARKMHEMYSLSEERLSSKYFAYNNTLMKMQELEGEK